VTGALAVVASQGDDLVKSELHSMVVALGIITVLMMIQMGTPLFGLVSLIPNIPPLATVFGIMGWFGIHLDSVTVFAATVAVGLAVDNTIHFVAQLKREMKLNPHLSVEQSMFQAYDLAGKPMAAWSIVTCLGFLALLATPFRASEHFGILVASAVFMGIFGDLIFMQSIILRFPAVRRLIASRILREMGGHGHPGENI
jgi:predicted RND superfamily exporter protein